MGEIVDKIRKISSSQKLTKEEAIVIGELMRRMCTGILIAEYALIEFQDRTKEDLKNIVLTAIRCNRKVQQWFYANQDAAKDHKTEIKKEFFDDKFILAGEIITLAMQFTSTGMEEIISELKRILNEQNDRTNDTTG